jgi:peptidoglycan/LPS O-acetylase OafA/YrhL
MVCAPVLLVVTNVAARVTEAEDKRFHLMVWLALVAAIPLAAMATYHLIEHPARKALRGVASRRAGRSTATKTRTESPERVLQPSETIV